MPVIEQTVFETIPTGTYDAVIVSIDETEGQFGSQLLWQFTIEGPTNEGSSIKGWTALKFSPKSRTFEWAQAAFGKPIPAGYNLDTDHLLGKKVKLVIVERVKPDGTEFSKIDGLRPIKSPQGPVSQNGEGESFPPKKENDDIPW